MIHGRDQDYETYAHPRVVSAQKQWPEGHTYVTDLCFTRSLGDSEGRIRDKHV